jgi:hypothetical protein
LDHLASAAQSADHVTATPLLSTIAGKGGFGHEYQNRANQYEEDREVAASELGKAVEGKLLTQGEADDWQKRLRSWTPEEFNSKAKPLADLLYDRMQEKRDQLLQLAPAGIITGLHGMSKRGVDSYNQITGKGIKYEDQVLDNDSSPSSQNANPIPQQQIVPKGMIPGYGANGQIIGYKDPTTNAITRF